MAATNFCEVYDCRASEFLRIDRFSDTESNYSFRIQDGLDLYNMGYHHTNNFQQQWGGNGANESLIPGHGLPLDIDGDGVIDTQIYKLASTEFFSEAKEFCHPGLGCTGFENGTGIILPPRDSENIPVYTYIPIPSQIAEDGAPIYSEDQDDYFGGGQDGGGSGEDCFVAGTKVKMSNGLEKNIEDIQIGEEVLSYNIHTKKLEFKKVTELYTQVHDLVGGDITVKTKFNNGIELHNTIANPFWSKDKGFVAADAERCNIKNPYVKETNNGKDTEQLKVGDTLYYHDGEELQEVMVTEIEHILEPYIRTYDIKVQDNHTFFANGILTHNSGGGGGIYGCTDSNACNYNPSADIDLGNCTYPSLCDDGVTMACPGECPEDEPLYPNGPNFLCCTPGTHQGTVITAGEIWAQTGTTVEEYITDDEEDEFAHNHGNNENLEACNQVDCSNPEPGFANVHFDAMCIGAIGQYGVHGHNVVFQYYYRQAYVYGQQGDLSLTHYPYVVSRTTPIYDEELEVYNADSLEYIDRHIHPRDLDIDYHRYFDPMPVSDPEDESTYNEGDLFNEWGHYEHLTPGQPEQVYENGILNPVLDRWQKGVDAEGNTLYDLPVYKKLTCNDVETKIGLDTTEYTGKISDYELAGESGGFVKSPFYTGNVDSLGYQLDDSVVEGIDVCGGSDLIEDAFDLLFSNPLYGAILVRILAQYGGEVWFEDINENWEIPSGEIGFGLGSSGVDEDIVGADAINYITDIFVNDTTLNRDVLIRIGFPLPPVSLWATVGDSDCPNDLRTSYLKIVEEFIGELESLAFFGGFEIPNVTIQPTMKSELDVLKGIDLRNENLNACDYIEFMILPGGSANGDGIYYKVNEVPDMYFEPPYDGNIGKENYVREFNCNTELDTDIQFSKMRAVCKDGSSVEMM